MANWAMTDYVIEGPKETVQKIQEAMLHPILPEDASKGWEGGVLKALGIEWQDKRPDGSGYYMRGFIQETPSFGCHKDTATLEFYAEEAWGATDFNEVLEKHFPDIKVYYKTEESEGEVYATNDKEGKYFPDRYYVDICIRGYYYDDYFTKKGDAFNYISEKVKAPIRTDKDIEKFNENCPEDDYIALHEFAIV